MKIIRSKKPLIWLCLAWVCAGQAARAADCTSLTIDAFDHGWYDAGGFHSSSNDNYFCGSGNGSASSSRNWFAFNIPASTQLVASAALRIQTFSIVTMDASETYELHQVTTPTANLRAGGSGLTNIYADLGDGPIYGSRTFLGTESGQFVTIPLNATFLSNLKAASGGTLAFGGRLTSLDGIQNSEYLFGNSGGLGGSNANVQLILTYSNASALTIVQQPASLTTIAGNTASFQVQVCGGGIPSFQWQRAGTNLAGATDPVLRWLSVLPQDAGPYQVVVTDSLTTVTSTVATLTVSNSLAPMGSIHVSLGQSPAPAGSLLYLCSFISGLPAPRLQWQFNGVNLPAQSDTCLYLSNVQTNQSGTYRLVASNVAGIFTSAPISLVVTQVPPSAEIYLAEGSTTPPAGSYVTLCSTVTGGPVPRLQWQFNGLNLAGQINQCLYLSNLQSNQSGSYRLVASNAAGAVTSAPIALAVSYSAPTGDIYLASGPSPVLAGTYVTICASISAAPYPNFQWQFNGVNLPSENGPCLALYSVSSNQAGLYRLVASNSVGVFTSAPVALAVIYAAPTGSIYFYYGQSPAPAGSTVTLCSTISAAPPASLQWQFKGVDLPGQIYPCLDLYGVSSNQAGLYRLVASNPVGVFTSAPLALAVDYYPPHGTIAPSGVLPPVLAGSSLSISSTMVGAPYPTFQWQFNEVDLPGQENFNLTLFNVETNQSGCYRLIARNSQGSFTSAVAVVSVVYEPPTATIYLSGGHSPTTVGTSLSLCSVLSGAPYPTVQWQLNGTNLLGETGYCLYLSNLQTNQSGAYTLVASNLLGVVTSQVATVSVVQPAPVLAYFIYGLPPLAVGSYQYMCAETSLPEAATLQWRLNGTNLIDATNYCHYLYPIQISDAGLYSVVATTPTSGVYTSPPIALTVYYAPPRTATPYFVLGNSSALVGEDISLQASYGGSPCFVQWRFNGVNLPGQTNSFLTMLAVTTNQSGHYSFTATNVAGMTTSSVVALNVSYLAPVFETDPLSQSVVEGGTVRFQTYAQAGPPPDYYLEQNGTNVAVPFTYEGCCYPATGGFTLFDTTFADAGNYRIIASNFLGSATSLVATLTVTPAGPLDRWTQRNPLPQSQPLLAVAHGTNQFVAVGERGTILTSPDGSNWALQNRRADVPLNGVAHGDGLFVAVGAGGTILTSSDGTNWAYRYTAAGMTLNDVTYAEGRFVAVGSAAGFSTLVLLSTDGRHWEKIPLNGYYAQQCIGYGHGLFIAAGGASVLRSTDGTNWSLALTFNRQIESVTYADGKYVLVGDDGSMLVSTDGTSWVSRAPVTSRRLLGVTYGAGRFVAAGARGTMITSTDGITWSAVASGTPDRLENIDYAGGLFVAVGENGTIITSTNGTAWTKQNFGITRDLDGMFAANGLLVVVGKGGSILTSTDGAHYTTQNAGVTNDLHGVTWGGGLWVAVGEPGVVLTSSNAVDWLRYDTGSTSSLKDITYAEGQWIVVGTQGTIVRSTDGVNWATTTTNPAHDLNAVAYGNGMFLVAGDGFNNQNGSAFRSLDGLSWSQVNFYPGKNLRGITFANGLFLISANDGVFYRTTNGLIFNAGYTSVPYSYYGNLRAATWSHDLWIVVGNDGAIITSPDLNTWTRRASRTFENQHQVALLDGKLVVIGNRGGILESDRFVTELETPVYVAGTGLQLPFKGVVNQAYQFQSSTNLVHWMNVLSFTNRAERSQFTDTNNLQLQRRFYRLVQP